MNHTPFTGTAEQRDNFCTVAKGLDTLKPDEPRFGMEAYHTLSPFEPTTEHPCDSVACVVGWAPALGVPARDGEDYVTYSERAFTYDSQEWLWCFNNSWCRVDDTPHGAAARIRYLLERGLPDNAQEQMLGEAPLSYRTTEETL